ncbi:MAG TPA: response regulator transcription factor, partial [Thermoanaerobaculia bacterium]|nr:response regulator transcription factor [Thermoanaerobaculia bacterium]
FGELLARLRALLRRGGATTSTLLQIGALEIDTRSRRVSVGSKPLTLTTKEYAVLEFLARNSGRVVTREEISEHVWNQDFDPFSNLIEVYMNRLRRHLARVSPNRFIQTVRGAGYVLEPDSAANGGV